MKHLITGGSGFLGNLIMNQLLTDGEEVKVLDIWKSHNHPSDVEFIDCDIRDREGVRKAMKGVDIVHNNVALVPLTKSGRLFWDVNVNGSKIAAEEAINFLEKEKISQSQKVAKLKSSKSISWSDLENDARRTDILNKLNILEKLKL